MKIKLGLRPRRLDLHVHSTESKCYLNKADTAKDLVASAIEKGLDGIAITDHNSAAMINEIKNSAKEFSENGQDLVIFPGVEISTHEGYHVVALFDPSKDQAHVENFLGLVDISPRQYGRSDETCKLGIFELLKKIHTRNGLAILAHIDTHKGVFFETTLTKPNGKLAVPKICCDVFNSDRYDAVEIIENSLPSEFKKERGFTRFPAFYWASDNPDTENPIKHSKDGVAERYTIFDLDEITLEGLRQCFADPKSRVRRPDEDISSTTWAHIMEMRIGKAGYLAYQNFKFHPGLNCIIGGKGVGKSLVVEFIRFILGQPSTNKEIKTDHNGKLSACLTPFNDIELVIQLGNGTIYSLKQTYSEDNSNPLECINQETKEKYAGDIAQLFPVLAYSQTEVIEISKDESAQLELIDSLVRDRVRVHQQEAKAIRERLSQSDREIVEALNAREQIIEAKQEIATIDEEIANIDRVLESPLLTEMREMEELKSIQEQNIEFAKAIVALQQKFLDELEDETLPDIDEDIIVPPHIKKQREQIEAAQENFQTALKGTGDTLTQTQNAVQVSFQNWLPDFESIKKAYEAELQGSDLADLENRRRELVAQKEKHQEEYKKCEQAANSLSDFRATRDELLDQLDQELSEIYSIRAEKFSILEAASENKLKLTLLHATNRKVFKKAVMDLWKGSGTSTISSSNRTKIAEKLSPRVLGDILLARSVERLEKEAELSQTMAERALDKVWSNDLGAALAIQYAYPLEDTPLIKFNKGNDNFAPLNELSVGQKSTALLIIALCDGQQPVIIDQPEDALDIASVWEDIAKKLRRNKHGRQFILTTHNSSLAVGGDSDNFMVLTPQSGNRAKVSYRGAIDRQDVRDAVIDHLEGGPEPYNLKHKKYNIPQ